MALLHPQKIALTANEAILHYQMRRLRRRGRFLQPLLGQRRQDGLAARAFQGDPATLKDAFAIAEKRDDSAPILVAARPQSNFQTLQLKLAVADRKQGR